MTGTCAECVFLKELKHNFVVGKGHEHSHCCVMLMLYKDGFVLEVDETSTCEEFRKKGQE